MPPVIDFSSGVYSTAELQTLLAAYKAEQLARASGGTIRSGGSAAQQYSMDKISDADLAAMINGIASALGFNGTETRVSPNFSGRPPAPYGTTFGV
jgi:hypothetical protein